MNDPQTIRALSLGRLFAALSPSGREVSRRVVEAYAEALGDIEPDHLAEAVTQLVRHWKGATFPRPGHVREAVELRHPPPARIEGPGEGPWMRVEDWLAAMGLQKLSDLVSLDATGRHWCVQAVEEKLRAGEIPLYAEPLRSAQRVLR